MSRKPCIPLLLLAASQCIFAQQAPSAGSQMQQIPPEPTPQIRPPKLDIKPGAAPVSAGPDGTRMVVKALRITGTQVFSEAELVAVSGFQPGTEMSLSELRAMAARIENHYHSQGYFVARAYLPAQDIQNGVVTIAVLDGTYGQVILHNQSKVSDGLLKDLLAGLEPGDTIRSAPLDSRLLMLAELPGVQVQSTLVPGRLPGTSDLVVNVKPGAAITGSIDADNAGNRYTGAFRVGATLNFNEPTGHGDVATLRVLTSGPGLTYARAAYQIQVGKAKLGAAYSYLPYELGREFTDLHANGNTRIATLYGSYPLLRGRKNNLSAQLAFDDKRFEDRIDAVSTVSDKRSQLMTASLYGDHRDDLGGGGFNTYSLSWATGKLDLRTAALRETDAATAQTNGNFNKVNFAGTRLQSVTDTVSLYAAIYGQVASKNLDVSEQIELGGMYAVRAYPEGEAFADEGVVLTLEARKYLERNAYGQLQLIGFVDTGTVTLNRNPWVAGDNRRTLSGIGVGLNWTGDSNYTVKAYYAHKLGSESATSAPDAAGRFWIQAVKYF